MGDRKRKLAFELTCLWFALRDRFVPPSEVLCEAPIGRGSRVLDYGCGPGSYSLAAAQLVGSEGHVYAVDVDPLAVGRVRRAVAARGIRNVTPILTGCRTGLESDSVDVALLYDTFHDLAEPEAVLGELWRVLKPGGALCFSDHHLQEDETLRRLTDGGLFRYAGKGRRTYLFVAEASRGM